MSLGDSVVFSISQALTLITLMSLICTGDRRICQALLHPALCHCIPDRIRADILAAPKGEPFQTAHTVRDLLSMGILLPCSMGLLPRMVSCLWHLLSWNNEKGTRRKEWRAKAKVPYHFTIQLPLCFHLYLHALQDLENKPLN